MEKQHPDPDRAATLSRVTRRSFLERAGAVAAFGLSSAPSSFAKAQATPPSSSAGSTFLDLLRVPDQAAAYESLDRPLPLEHSGSEWRGSGVEVSARLAGGEVAITLSAPGVRLKYLHLRWNALVATDLVALGDHWERSYGDLGWRPIIPERVMPWYFATWDGSSCHAYGVKTSARSLCFWQLDPQGVSLWLNTANGGQGVQLGRRELLAAEITTRAGSPGEDPTHALHAFCRQLCSQAALPAPPVYGCNDWYYAYGKNTAQQILRDTGYIAGLSAGNAVRPFSVIDMGWADGSPAFPSMARLAEEIHQSQVRPGIWIRPLQAPAGASPALLLPDARFGSRRQRTRERAYDPTIPESQQIIAGKIRQLVEWKFELVKHDFSTYDLLGQWGFEMGADPTLPGWSLHDPGRTNAEVLRDLYRLIRGACAPGTLILGCNTVGHLGQGIFDIQRTGDDTSGRQWERTRRMGINTLAFRLPQHQSFFVQDADCVGLSPAIPWQLNRQWLDLLARSGTALFISPGEGSRGAGQALAIRQAFALAASGGAAALPATWRQQSTPEQWTVPGANAGAAATIRYDWCSPGGAYPFTV
ncbi:MAG TPA: hypothetical protein VGR96_01310 [Acidobacteriaceae bacterium]|nr:hypothetical protein [Acidobacteriaceae bacterium]